VPIIDAAARAISRDMVSFSEQKKLHTELAKLSLVVVKRGLPVIHGSLFGDTSIGLNGIEVKHENPVHSHEFHAVKTKRREPLAKYRNNCHSSRLPAGIQSLTG
jgi:hypothetical protein